jgi:hypothetical protein
VSPGVDTTNRYAVTCESQPLDAPGCKGVPNDIWGPDTMRRCEGTVSYPEGCVVYLPSENPYYAGTQQRCTCERFPPNADTASWGCPI